MIQKPLFYAKIMLFGEYGIIENSKGLTIPYDFYKGAFGIKAKEEVHQKSNHNLKLFLNWIESSEFSFSEKLDLKAFKKDIEKGLYFDSTIPEGYGVGSSGALVAAIYDRYSLEKVSADSLQKNSFGELKTFFGKMESFFHGKSSGIDPLICYLNIPILIENSDVSKVGLLGSGKEVGKGAIFLINSGTPGETAPMIEIFFNKLKNQGFRKTLREEFIQFNNKCIEAFVGKKPGELFTSLKSLSVWALEHFRPMIPASVLDLWQKGIDSNLFYLKLCGSGGGGYVLGFTPDFEKAQHLLEEHNPEIVHRF